MKNKDFTAVGRNNIKVDALALATGAEKFVDDFEVKDPLYISVLYSPYAHAKILDIDAREEDAHLLPDVVAEP